MKKIRGSITVEATIVLPIYILMLVFFMSFLNIFYIKMVVQSGLNNAGTTISQYCYAIDLTLPGGMSNFTLKESTPGKVNAISDGIDDFVGSAQRTLDVFNKPFSLDLLSSLINNGRDFLTAGEKLAKALKNVDGDDIKNYLFASAAETGGGLLVKTMVERYLDDMGVNRGLIDGDIEYEMYISNSNSDLVLIARYLFKNSTFSIFMEKPFYIEQQVVVHPWIGGSTKGLRKPS